MVSCRNGWTWGNGSWIHLGMANIAKSLGWAWSSALALDAGDCLASASLAAAARASACHSEALWGTARHYDSPSTDCFRFAKRNMWSTLPILAYIIYPYDWLSWYMYGILLYNIRSIDASARVPACACSHAKSWPDDGRSPKRQELPFK